MVNIAKLLIFILVRIVNFRNYIFRFSAKKEFLFSHKYYMRIKATLIRMGWKYYVFIGD